MPVWLIRVLVSSLQISLKNFIISKGNRRMCGELHADCTLELVSAMLCI